MVKKKGKSKRISLNDKYKVQRRVVESHRKSRKKAKRDAKAGIINHLDKKKKKDPGIPNSWPFKQDLLNEVARARELAEQRRIEQKKVGSTNTIGKRENLEELLARANASRAEFDAKQSMSTDTSSSGSCSGNAPKKIIGTTIKKSLPPNFA